MGVLSVFHKSFEGAIMSFHECLQKDLNISVLCFKGVLGCFCKKKELILCKEARAAINANSIGQKHPKTTLGTPIIYSRITLKYY